MDVETIIKLIDAGYTKAEIEQMTQAPVKDQVDPAPSEAPEKEPAPDPVPETEPVKKNSSSGEENEKLLALEEKMKNLENRFYKKNLAEATIEAKPPEEQTISGIFAEVFKEE